ncbi:MAG: hypothetical protein JXA57_17810 [Armatimonadetes bacterium]|nr:hypothetical protein [Armatimonadota bacterium]
MPLSYKRDGKVYEGDEGLVELGRDTSLEIQSLRNELDAMQAGIEAAMGLCRHRVSGLYDTCEDNCGMGYRYWEQCAVFLASLAKYRGEG